MSKEEFIKTWTICDNTKDQKLLQNRINKRFERYNQTMNETISTHCPSLQELVTTLEVEARFQVTKLEKIRRGKVVA